MDYATTFRDILFGSAAAFLVSTLVRAVPRLRHTALTILVAAPVTIFAVAFACAITGDDQPYRSVFAAVVGLAIVVLWFNRQS